MKNKNLDSIVLYSTETCHQCDSVKRDLETQGIDYSLQVVGKDISVEKFVKKYEVQKVPLMEINGKDVYKNFSEIKFYVKHYFEGD